MKKILLLMILQVILSLVIILGSCDWFEEKLPPSEGLKFELSEDGSYYILVGKGTCTDSRIVIPSKYEGKPVKSIAYHTDNEWGYESDTEEVVIPEGVTTIEANSFEDCVNLKTVHLPKSLKTIGEYAFHLNPIESVYIKDLMSWLNVTGYIPCAIADYYFNGELFTEFSIYFPLITEIRERAFYGCRSLKEVTIPYGVVNICENAFADCGNLKTVKLSNTVENIGKAAFYNCDIEGELTIPDSVKSIDECAFSYNLSLTRVVIGKGVENIGDDAFEGCSALFEVCNQSSLDIQKGSSLHGEIALNAKLVTTDKSLTYLKNIDGYVFYYYLDGLQGPAYLLGYRGNETNLKLPELGCGYVINENVFFENPFFKKEKIESVIIPGCVTEIGHQAFGWCDALKSVVISEGVETIGTSSFDMCSSLEYIEIPSSVSSIGKSTFSGCYSLKTIKYDDTFEKWCGINDDSDWNQVPTRLVCCSNGTYDIHGNKVE